MKPTATQNSIPPQNQEHALKLTPKWIKFTSPQNFGAQEPSNTYNAENRGIGFRERRVTGSIFLRGRAKWERKRERERCLWYEESLSVHTKTAESLPSLRDPIHTTMRVRARVYYGLVYSLVLFYNALGGRTLCLVSLKLLLVTFWIHSLLFLFFLSFSHFYSFILFIFFLITKFSKIRLGPGSLACCWIDIDVYANIAHLLSRR